MKDSVRTIFPTFSERFEGSVPHGYLDIKQIVTIAIGNACFSPAEYMSLPLVQDRSGLPASDLEKVEEYRRLLGLDLPDDEAAKHRAELARLGHRAAKAFTRLHLTPEGVAEVVRRKLEQNDLRLLRRFPDFEKWPADAQIATHSLVWACGANFSFPRLTAALQRQDWRTAARECHIEDSHNAGVRPRNAANERLYLNAAIVAESDADPSVVYWPVTPMGLVPEPPSTKPELECGTLDEIELGDGPTVLDGELRKKPE